MAAPVAARRATAARCGGPCPRRASSRAGSAPRTASWPDLDHRGDRCRRGGGARPWTRPAITATSRVAWRRATSSSCDASSTVRPSAGAAASTASTTARPSASRPACGSSSSSNSGSRRKRDGEREAPPLPLRETAVCDAGDVVEPDTLDCGVGFGRVWPAGAGRESHVLRHREVVVGERLVPDHADRSATRAAVRPSGRGRAPMPSPTHRQQPRAEPQQRRLARAVGAREQHDLTASTSRSAPASAGNRPSRHTADRRLMTRLESARVAFHSARDGPGKSTKGAG